MDALDILSYGHKHVLDAVSGLDDEGWLVPRVTTAWSVKDVIAHLASFELLLEDALRSVIDPSAATPTLAKKGAGGNFSADEVSARSDTPHAEVLAEYARTHERVMGLAQTLSPERLRERGTIPWYGEKYSLDDLIVYMNYAHKREHSAQIRLFRKREGFQAAGS